MKALLVVLVCFADWSLWGSDQSSQIDQEWSLCEVTSGESAIGPAPVGGKKGFYLVKFYTPTCGPCITWDSAQKPMVVKAGITVTRVDASKDLSWGISSVPAFWLVSRKTGLPVKKWTSYTTAKTIISEYEKQMKAEKDSGDSTAFFEVVPVDPPVELPVVVAEWHTVPETWPARVRIDGTNYPSKSSLLRHLRSSNHSGSYFSSWPLDEMTPGQLATLHDSEHGYSFSSGGVVVRSSRPAVRSYTPVFNPIRSFFSGFCQQCQRF